MEKSRKFRQDYIDELKRDLEEITGEIIKTESMKDILSMLTTKYAIERNILSLERTLLAEENALLGEKTDSGILRTYGNVGKPERACPIADPVIPAPGFSCRKENTYGPAADLFGQGPHRTGLHANRYCYILVVLAIGLMRYFGLGWWTLADGFDPVARIGHGNQRHLLLSANTQERGWSS